jgi:hypothetical protein
VRDIWGQLSGTWLDDLETESLKFLEVTDNAQYLPKTERTPRISVFGKQSRLLVGVIEGPKPGTEHQPWRVRRATDDAVLATGTKEQLITQVREHLVRGL